MPPTTRWRRSRSRARRHNQRMHILAALLLAAAIQVTAPVWKDAPPAMPPGTQIAVLEGDPKQAGMFTIRLKLKAGALVEPHTHPRPERVTVLSGKVLVGFGADVGEENTKAFTAGGFYVN